MHTEIFQNIARRQIEGIMFHDEMSDYYGFLQYKELQEAHKEHFLKESKTLRKIKDYYLCEEHKILYTSDIKLNIQVIPSDWKTKTSLDVDEVARKTFLKQSLEMYHKWEEETLKIYKEAAETLFQHQYFEEYKFVRCLCENVQMELSNLEDLTILLSAHGYDITKIKDFDKRAM